MALLVARMRDLQRDQGVPRYSFDVGDRGEFVETVSDRALQSVQSQTRS